MRTLSSSLLARTFFASLSAGAAVFLGALPVFADGTALRADLVEPHSIKLDGMLKEWPEGTVNLAYTLKGSPNKLDFSVGGTLAYDSTYFYVGADVTDDVFKPGGDHIALVLGFPGGTLHEIELFPGDPGKTTGKVTSGGSPVSGAHIVESTREKGWIIEAAIPWSAFPEAKTLRVGMRGALLGYDADDSTTPDAMIGSAPETTYASLPPISTESEQALSEGLLRDKDLREAPRFNLIADVAGDSMKERIILFDRYLVVLGPGFRKGTEYYWKDLGVDGSMLPLIETRDLTGDGQAEILIRKRFGSGGKWREMLQALSFGSGEAPNPIFQHEVGIASDANTIANNVSFLNDGGKVAIKVQPGTASGWTAASYREPTESDFDSILLPWGRIKSQTYRFSGTSFSKASEEKQAGVAGPPPSAAASASTGADRESAPSSSLPKAPPPPSSAELQKEVLELYKKERGASGAPRFDFAADVAGGPEVERVVFFDRDVVVFGKGYKGGTGYSYLTLAQFGSSADVVEVTSRDLTGDGKAEIVLRGVLHANPPRGAGIKGTIDREVVLVLQVSSDGIKRIFGAETARGNGKKRVADAISFASKGISIAPGSATDWSEKTYPFNQDSAPVGGYEPLLLPWGGATPAKYTWNGTSFAK